ncbi:MAG: hypothetical protein IK090_03550 [Clostridia bacterium]|nr:hypothetical protein [Clostridia bacterium]
MRKIQEILSSFIDATQDIESLEDYYHRSKNTLISYKLDVEKSFALGKKIADILDGLLRITKAEDRNRRINDINKTFVYKKLRFRDICEIVPFEKDNQSSISFLINSKLENYERFDPLKAKKKYDQIDKYTYIMIESVLSHIIVSFEAFLTSIYRILLLSNPQKYLEGQTIFLATLFDNNLNEVVNDRLESEVAAKLYNSLETVKIIAEKEKISLDSYSSLIAYFKELYYRRNAYVHTKGRVNKDYLTKVDRSFTKNLQLNDELICDDVYLKHSICVLNQIVFSITYELLKKEKISSNRISVLINYYFGKLCSGDYQLTKFAFLKLSTSDNMEFSDKLICRINYLISAKQMNEIELVKEELGKLDVSAAVPRFKIAKECLSDNFETVLQMLNETYPDSFDARALKEWPLFISFRETEYYSIFVASHQADFAIQTLDDYQSEIEDLLLEESLEDQYYEAGDSNHK